MSFTLQCNNWITHYRWQSYNTKEPETLDWIDHWVGEGNIFFDIGANVGVYSIYAALRHPKARIVAFEPEYANLHLLRDNIVTNGLEGRVDVYAIAFSNRSGLSYLHIQDFTPGSALHTESRNPLDVTRAQKPVVWREGIYTLTLDEFCAERGLQPTYIKIDVDGSEPEVLEGGIQTLALPQLYSIIIEVPGEKGKNNACEQMLVNAGLRRMWQDPLGRSPNEVWVGDSSGSVP